MRYFPHINLIFLAIFCYFFFSPLFDHAFAQSAITFTQNKTILPTYDIEEITFNLPSDIIIDPYDTNDIQHLKNPYNPDIFDVYALITPPGSYIPQKVIAFWSENITVLASGSDRYQVVPNSGVWKVRYAPQKIGTYTFHIEAKVKGQPYISTSGTFSATASQNKGFITTDPNNPTRFMFENNEPFIGIGTNLDWDQTYSQYEVFFATYKQNKMNFARVWNITPFAPNFLLEWKGNISKDNNNLSYQGIGRYNQESAYKLDEMFKNAAANDVYIMLCLQTYHTFWNWMADAGNPYRDIVQGDGHKFWTEEEMKKYFKWYTRYITARYSSYTSFAILEFFNEMDNRISPLDLTNGKTIMRNWYQGDPLVPSDTGMIGVVNASTPRKLLTTTSFAAFAKPWNDGDGTKSFSTLTQLDVAQAHHYDSSSNAVNMVWGWGDIIRYGTARFNRPFFIGEYGNLGEDKDQINTKRAALLRLNHHSLWVPIMHGEAAASNLLWRVDWSFLPPSDFLANYKRFYTWIESELSSLRSMSWFYSNDSGCNSACPFWAGGYKKADRAIVYFYNKDALWTREDNQFGQVSSISYNLSGMTNGSYRIEFTNPYTGEVINPIQSVSASNGTISITLPSFKRDLAVKITPQSSTSPSSTPTPTKKIGDVNGNGTVTIVDYNIFLSSFKMHDENADFNKNGTVDIFDYSRLIENFAS